MRGTRRGVGRVRDQIFRRSSGGRWVKSVNVGPAPSSVCEVEGDEVGE